MDKLRKIYPNNCPECGTMAYVGLNEIRCPNVRCKYGSEEERQRYYEAGRTKTVAEGENAPENPSSPEETAFEDADTDPQMDFGKLFGQLDAKLEMALRPFGSVEVEPLQHFGEFRVTLYNPPTGLYVSERLSVDYVTLYPNPQGFADFLAQRLQSTFPRELARAWARRVDDVDEDTVLTNGYLKDLASNTGLYQLPKGTSLNYCLGDAFGSKLKMRIVGIDRIHDQLRLQVYL